MSPISTEALWTTIVLLGIGTFAVRFSFLGFANQRQLPPWALRALRYVPTSVLPALIAPMVVWPDATGGEPDLPRALAALAALVIGAAFRNVLAAIGAGLFVLYVALATLA